MFVGLSTNQASSNRSLSGNGYYNYLVATRYYLVIFFFFSSNVTRGAPHTTESILLPPNPS